MTTKNDGGPAFPQIDTETVGSQGEYQDRVYSYGGMTLRDYFAGKAMHGMVASGVTIDIDGEHLFQKRAATAYAIADAMLAARSAS